jgi:hypothetical protein
MTETSYPKRGRGRPKGSVQELNLQAVEALAQIQATEEEVALELNVSSKTIQRRLASSVSFKRAYLGGKNRGKLAVRRAMFLAIMDRCISICKNPDCERIRIDTERFYDECPYCHSVGLNPQTGEPVHYGVKQILKDGNTRLMEFWAKNFLGMTDKVEVGGSKDKPALFSTLAEFTMYATAKKRSLAIKNEEKAN